MASTIKIISFGRALKNGLSFSVDYKNLLTYFIVLLVEMVIIFEGFALVSANPAITSGITQMQALVALLPYLACVVVTALIDLLFTGAFINRYKTGKGIIESLKYSASRYITLFVVLVIVTSIMLGLALFPALLGVSQLAVAVSVVCLVVIIVVSIALLFVYQEVIIAKSNVIQTFKNSWALFKNEWINMLLTAIITIIVMVVIVFIFAIPFLATVVGFSPAYIQSLIELNSLTVAVITGGALKGWLAATGIIAVVGLTISKLLSIGVFTDAYSQLKKK